MNAASGLMSKYVFIADLCGSDMFLQQLHFFVHIVARFWLADLLRFCGEWCEISAFMVDAPIADGDTVRLLRYRPLADTLRGMWGQSGVPGAAYCD